MRNPYFDYSRAICLAMVCWVHFALMQVPRPTALLISFNGYSLTFFFVLSGYLIHSQLSMSPLNTASLKKFYWNRSLRIFPAYYLVSILAAIFIGVPYAGWIFTYTLNIKLFLISLDPKLFQEYMAHWYSNGIHFWSMGIEEQFYILYPLFLMLLSRRLRVPGILSLVIIFWIIHLILLTQWPSSYYGALLPVCGQNILIGALVSELKIQGRLPSFKGKTLIFFVVMLLTILMLGISTNPNLTHFKPLLWLPFIALSMALFIYSLDLCPPARWTTKIPFKILAYVGRISYGVYLVHLFWLEFFFSKFSDQIRHSPMIVFTLFLAFSIFQGTLIWELVEKRINSRRNKIH